MTRRLREGTLLLCVLGLATTRARAAEEPGGCVPPCRSGYFCKAGKCVSLCNPPCPYGDRCVRGECKPVPGNGRPDRESYLGVLGVFHGALNDSATHLGELRVEFGGRYTALQLGPAFGDKIMALRSAIQGHVPFQPVDDLPFFIIPTIAVGYSIGWIDEEQGGRQQDIFIAPGLRLRYDLVPRLALFFDPGQLQITFLRLYSAPGIDLERVDVVPISWNVSLGLAFLY